jgi:hypothetical protein
MVEAFEDAGPDAAADSTVGAPTSELPCADIGAQRHRVCDPSSAVVLGHTPRDVDPDIVRRETIDETAGDPTRASVGPR